MTTGRQMVSLTRVTGILLAGRVVGFGLLLINSVVLARSLGVEALGTYGYATGLAALFGLVPNLGITTLITRAVAQDADHSREFFRRARQAQTVLGAAVFVAVVLLAAILPYRLVPIDQAALAALQLSIGSFSWPYLALLGGRGRYDRLALSEFVTGVGGTGIVLMTAAWFGTVTSFLCANVVTALAANVVARMVAKPFLPASDGPACSFGTLFRQAIPFGTGAIVQSLYRRVDMVLLGQLTSAATVGLYSAAYKPINMLVNFGSSAAGTLFPFLVQESRSGPSGTFDRVLRVFVVVAPVVALLFNGLARPLLVLLYGPEFTAAATMLSILAWSAAANWLYAPVSIALQARGMERWWMAGSSVAFIANVSLNWWLIPRWGGEGAAVATLVCEGWLLIAGMWVLQRTWNMAPAIHTSLACCAATLCSAGLLFGLRPWGDVAATAGAVTLYAALTFLFRVATTDDIAKLLGRFRESMYGHARA